MKQLRQKTVQGVAWSATGKMGQQVLALAVMVVLARLLAPEDFGQLAMVLVVAGFAGLFKDLGFGSALIHRQDATEAHRSSVFWINVGAGALLTGIVYALAPWVAAFYGEPLLEALTQVIAFNFLLSSLAILQNTLFQKELDFRRIAVADIVGLVVGAAVAIGVALAGFGVWALVVKHMLSTAVTTGLLWFQSPWRPRFLFEWNAVRELLGFSSSRFGLVSLNYWTRNLDNLLIGRVIGADALGLYSRAYAFLLLPLINVTRVVSNVAFPSFASIQHDPARVRRAFLKGARLVALLTVPMMLALAVLAEPFVLVFFGEQWTAMIPLVRVFAVIGVLESINKLDGTLYLSQGRADLMLWVGLVTKGLLIAGIVAGLRFGVMGVALGYGLATLVGLYPSFYFAGRLVGLSFGAYLRELAPGAGCALAMAVAVWGVEQLAVPPLVRLVLGLVVAAVVYGGLLHVLRVEAYRDVRALLAERRAPKPPRRPDSRVHDPRAPGTPPLEPSGPSNRPHEPSAL